MLPLGLMLLVIGGAVLGLARPLHEGWRDMNRRARGAGHRDMIFGTEFFASDRGLRTMRGAGAAMAVTGLALLVGWGSARSGAEGEPSAIDSSPPRPTAARAPPRRRHPGTPTRR